GNGFHSQSLDDLKLDYKDFTARDVAGLFAQGLDQLKINKLFAVIGGSVGGGIAWELAALRPKLIENLIPVAADWKATDWVIANCFIQDSILNNSSKPLSDARMHAMTLYRTPESFADKFNRTKRNKSLFNVESWLNHHGEKLTERFQVSAYKIVNQLLKTIDITQGNENFLEVASRIESNIHIITINSDLLFKTEENWNTYVNLRSIKENVTIGEIESIHGHDAFLIEYQQLSRLLRPVFHSEEKKSLISSYNYNLKRIA
ncbi:MAG: alpha/beta fold hydrolase, partial [Mangrovimonas sp.]|nr:alpha/beta fold hydrolase [Mangrovimonas sp.]